MRKLKTYRIYFSTRNLVTQDYRRVIISVNAFSLKDALSTLRSVGYTISRDYYYFVNSK